MKKFFLIICAAVIFLSGCSKEPPVEVRAEKIISVDGTLTLTHEGKISAENFLPSFWQHSRKIFLGRRRRNRRTTAFQNRCARR